MRIATTGVHIAAKSINQIIIDIATKRAAGCDGGIA